MRSFSVIAIFVVLGLFVGCSNNGTPAGVQITVSVASTATSLNPGGTASISASVANSTNTAVTWSITPAGFGTLSSTTANPVTYTAPTTVATATAVTITATSAASSAATGSVQIAVASSAGTVTLSPAAPQTINQAGTLAVSATPANTGSTSITWTLTGPGSLSGTTGSSITYTAPPTVTAPSPATLTATSGSATGTLEITVLASGAGPNVAALNVNQGTAGVENIAFVSLLICTPGSTTQCGTVDNIQVDTGSEGLRILQSAIPANVILPTLTDTSGNTIFNCVNFADTSYLWGPVQQANIQIGSETASQALVQVVSNSTNGIPSACPAGGSSAVDENTPQLLGANGIIGIGPEPTDCTLAGENLCDGSLGSVIDVYFDCPSSGCPSTQSATAVDASDQVVNPIVLFTDNNGSLISFPSLASVAPTLSGTLIFGINTQTNNSIGSATVFGMDNNDNFITLYPATGTTQTLNASFIDSGSNGLFFPSTLTACTGNLAEFYCPASLTAQSATQEGATGSPAILIDFNIDNASNLFTNNPNDFAFATLGGSNGTYNSCAGGGSSADCTFDWGLPFFYGRNVFTAIDEETVSGVGAGPFWAWATN